MDPKEVKNRLSNARSFSLTLISLKSARILLLVNNGNRMKLGMSKPHLYRAVDVLSLQS